MKILNLYAGIGGNRKLWGDEHEITAVEYVPEIVAIYRELFPKDKVLVEDAHAYLLNHFREFDFIWSSPPCQTHGSFRKNIGVRFRGVKAKYPDITLYEEILFLQHHAVGKWVVENVKPYYKPLIEPTAFMQRHMFWSNFPISEVKKKPENLRSIQIPDLERLHGFNLSTSKLSNKRQVLRNCVAPELGSYILNCAL